MTPELRKRNKEMENDCMALKTTLALMHILLIHRAWQKHMVTMPVVHYNGSSWNCMGWLILWFGKEREREITRKRKSFQMSVTPVRRHQLWFVWVKLCYICYPYATGGGSREREKEKEREERQKRGQLLSNECNTCWKKSFLFVWARMC